MIPAPPGLPPQIPSTQPLMFQPGGLIAGDLRLPFYATTMTAARAASEISLPRDMPVSATSPVDLAELFQRDLDEERVREDIVSYLRRLDTPKFFNSITVALLPTERAAGRVSGAEKYRADENVTPAWPLPGYERNSVGQVAIFERPGDNSHGYIAWNPDHTMPVVLDGQHRLFALKEILKNPNATDYGDIANSQVSVLFLIIDPRAGFEQGSGTSTSVLQTCRAVFIDLNRHARQVSAARNILLDDRNLFSVATRAILAERLETTDERPVKERVSEELRLPLSLIDFRSETAKFDSGPYLTSVLSLHASVQSVLEIAVPAADEYEQLRTFISRLCARVRLQDIDAALQAQLDARLTESALEERPFALEMQDLRTLGEAFRRTFGPRILFPLIGLSPYRKLLANYAAGQITESPHEAWLVLDDTGRKVFAQQQSLAGWPERVSAAAAAGKGGDLAYQVVFQRAIIALFHELVEAKVFTRAALGIESESEEDLIVTLMRRWDERLAVATSLGAQARSPFVGAGIRADGTIDFRKTRIRSITGFMAYAVAAPADLFASRDIAKWRAWVDARFALITPGSSLDAEKNYYSRHGVVWKRGLSDIVAARSGGDVTDEAVAEAAALCLVALAAPIVD